MMNRSKSNETRTGPNGFLRIVVLLGAIVLAGEGTRHLGARVEGALAAAGFLTGPGPDGLFETAALPVLVVLVILFFKRDIRDDRGLRLAAMGLGAGAGILLADPLARIALHFGVPGLAPSEEVGILRTAANLLVLAVVGILFTRAVIRELRGPGRGGPTHDEGDED